MNRFLIIVLSVAFAAACSGPPPEKAHQPTVDFSYFYGGRLIPGDGSAPIEEATMTVRDGKILQIGQKGEIKPPEGAARIDLAGKTIMPLLINVHAHVGYFDGATFSSSNYSKESIMADLNRYGYYGLGAVQALGSDKGDVAFEVREGVRNSKTGIARFYTAGRGITARGGWPTGIPALREVPYEVGSEADARKAVAELADKKVDIVKIWVDDNMGRYPKLNMDISRAVIDEAHKRNLKVVAHAFYLADAKELVNAGVDGLVHSVRDREVDGTLISAMKDKNVYYSPTLTAHESGFVYADKPSWLGEQFMREVYPSQLSAYLADSVTVNRFKRNPDIGKLRQQYNVAAKNLKKIADAGITIVMGTDSGTADRYVGYFEHRELELMAKAGMTPAAVIQASTGDAAHALGAQDFGTLAAGKSADFFVLTSNPLDEITNTRDIDEIYRGGHEVDRLGLVQSVTIAAPKVTDADRQRETEEQRKEALAAAEARLPHYGKFVLGSSANVRGMAVPTPKGSKANVQPGPPDRIAIAMKASQTDLSEFYLKALPVYQWRSQGGNCFGRPHPLSNKPQVLCVQAAANSVTIQITER